MTEIVEKDEENILTLTSFSQTIWHRDQNVNDLRQGTDYVRFKECRLL